MKIGIGIPTYNRLDSLKKTIKSIEAYADLPYDLFVSIDGSPDETLNWVKGKYEYINQHRIGVIYSKNNILRRFKTYPYIFIIEDDVMLLKKGVFSLYIKAMKLFKIQHFNFLVDFQRKSAVPNKTIDGITVMYSSILGGCFSTFTKEVINKVGGFNPQFKGYGHGHCEYTLRIARAGLTSKWGQFAHVVNAEPYIKYRADIKRSTDADKIKLDRDRNHDIIKITNKNSRIVYIPL